MEAIIYVLDCRCQLIALCRNDLANPVSASPVVTPGLLRQDLYVGLPDFRCSACAHNAEGLTRAISTQLGSAHSDQLNNRMKGKVVPCEARTSAN